MKPINAESIGGIRDQKVWKIPCHSVVSAASANEAVSDDHGVSFCSSFVRIGEGER